VLVLMSQDVLERRRTRRPRPIGARVKELDRFDPLERQCMKLERE
jgi:hypothetical protein